MFSNPNVRAQCTDISFQLSITPSSCSSACEFDVRISNHNIEGGMWLYSVNWVKVSSTGAETAIVDSGPSDGVTFSNLQLVPNGEIERGILKINLSVFTKIGARIVKKDINGQTICTTTRYVVNANAPAPPPPPAPALSVNPIEICEKKFIEETATFTVTSPSGYTFKWYEYGSSTQIGSSPNLKYTLNGSGSMLTLNLQYFLVPEDFTQENGKLTKKYTVCTTGGGCTTAVLILEPPPVISAFPNLTVCQSGGTVALTDAIPSGGTWEGFGIENGNSFNPSITGPGQHSVTYRYTDPMTGCSSSKDRTITVEGGVNAGPDIAICSQIRMVELTGASPAGGVWSGPGVSGNVFQKNDNTGPAPYTTTYTYTFPSGCVVTDTRLIREDNGLPTLVAPNVTGESPICINSSSALTATNPNTGFGTPETVYVYWFSGSQYAFEKQSVYDQDRSFTTANLNQSTSFHAQFVWKNASQTQICGSSPVSKTVTVVQPPTAPVLESQNVYSCPYDVNLEQPVQFKVLNASGLTYRWYELNADGAIIQELLNTGTSSPYSFTGTGNSILNIAMNRLSNVIYPTEGTTLFKRYAAVAESASECNSNASSTGYLYLASLPSVSAGGSLSTCANSTPITLQGIPSGGTWSGLGIENGNMFNPAVAGVGETLLSYSYQDPQTGCQASASKQITVNDLPTAPVVADTEASYNKTTTLEAWGAIYPEGYRWYASDMTFLGTGQTFVTDKITQATTYFVTKLNSETSCESTPASLTVNVIFNNYNFVWEDIVKTPEVNDAATVEALSETGKTTVVSYIDGLGRPIQSVTWKGSPTRMDMVSPIEYDSLGRESIKYSPYVSDDANAWYKENALADANNTDIDPLLRYRSGDQYQFYQMQDAVAHDNFPYSKTIFESSPLNRIVEQGAPGEDWQPDQSNSYASQDRTIKKAYASNTSDEVLLWSFSYVGQSSLLGLPSASAIESPTTLIYFAPGVLYKNNTKDEEHNEVIEYVDKQGRTVLKKVESESGIYAQTYYIYDDLNNLVCVIPPQAVANIIKTPSDFLGKTDVEKEAFLKRWTFRYRYDARKRMTIKQVPGAEPVYMVYDDRDRLVLTQDGNQRATAPYYWTFTKYDELNRPVLTGIKDTAVNVSQADMQLAVDDHYSKPGAVWGERYSGTGPIHGYTNRTYPVMTSESIADPNHYLTVTYYDNYHFRNLWLDSYIYSNEGLSETVNGVVYTQPAKEASYVRGQVTGTKVKVLDGGIRGGYIYLKSVNYFDEKYRLVQSIADNYKGGQDRTTNLFDFVGNVVRTKTVHSTNEISWQGLENAVAVGNNINKVLVSNGWSTGGMTAQQLPAGADGWIEYIISDPNQITAFGLSESHEDHRYITMDYCFYLNLGVGQIYEDGGRKGDFSATVKSGDVIRIERVGTSMNYYFNGGLVHSTDNASGAALRGDVSINTRLGNIVVPRASFAATSNYVTRRFIYDHAGRLTEVWHGINGPPDVRIVHNEYNALGQLIDKKLHSSAPSASDAVQSVDYAYNIRGWLTHMNDDDLSAGGSSEPTDYFSFQLAYQEVETGLNNVPAFNGNISAMKWASNLGIGDEKMRAYSYVYDNMNRITGATFKTASGLPNSLSWSTPLNEAFSATGYDYDLNGNILGLIRKGKDGNEIDSLEYDYGTGDLQSNVLLSVTDDASKSEGFAEIVSEGNDYEYDENGNLVWDKNKGGEEVLQNGSFSQGSNGWVVTDTGGRLTFENDSVSITSHATASATLRQDDIIRPRAVYVVIVDVDRQAGNFSISLGNGGNKWIGTSGKTVFTDDAGGGDDFVVTIPPSFVGQIKSIEVKGIVVISYNHLNLPERIVKGLQQSMGYIYDATGRKISQEVYDEQGLIVKKSDYEGEFFYENDTLRFINHEEGRAIISDAAPEYQYHLKDHLGNVRLTFTTKEEIEATKATLEPENFDNENSSFVRYENARKVQSYFFDRTNGASPSTVTGYAHRLNGGTNEKFGLGRSLSVMPGDKITAEVYAKYVDPDAGSRTDGLNSLLSQIAQQIASGATTSGLVIDGQSFNTSTTSFPFPTEAGLNTAGSSGVGPKAYLNWLVFDRDYNFLLNESGYMRLSDAPKESGQDVAHQRLYSPEIVIKQAGYVYIYLSNENETPVGVYFDEFRVEHLKSPVVQMDDYYPFGLTYNSYSRERSPAQNYKYNGKEEQTELGLGWLDYQARQYDATLGKFLSIDPNVTSYTSWTPYHYVHNNPLKYVDPDGQDATIAITGNTITISTTIYIYGSGASSSVAATYQAGIMKEWGATSSGGKWTYTDKSTGTTYDVVFDVAVKVYDPNDPTNDPAIIPESWDPSNTDNFIEVDNASGRSHVTLGDEGVWRGKGRGGRSLASDNPAPHEFGHLVGLKDRYTDSKGADSGWSGNIMAEAAMRGKPDQRNIDGIVNDAFAGYAREVQKFEDAKNGVGNKKQNERIMKSQAYKDYINGTYRYNAKIDDAFPSK